MNRNLPYESKPEPLDEEERLLMDPESWDWERTEEGAPVPNPGAIFEIVFTREEVARVEPLAHAAGMTLHEFIKQAALARLPHEAHR